MGVISCFPSLYEQPDFKSYTIYNEENGVYGPVTGAYISYNISSNWNGYKSIQIGNIPGHVSINVSPNFNSPIIFPENIRSLYNVFVNCKNFYSDIYVKTNQVTNVNGFVRSVKGANIYVKPEMETLFRTNNSQSILGRYVTWTDDTPNFRFYNTSYNLNVFYNYEG